MERLSSPGKILRSKINPKKVKRSSPQTLAQVGMIIGLRVANTDAMPMWRTTSPFNKPRNPPKTLPAN